MKQLRSYIDIRKNQNSSSKYSEFFNTIFKDDYSVDTDIQYIERLQKTFKMTGKCVLLDVIVEGIMSLLDTGRYKISVAKNSAEYIEKYDKFISIYVYPRSDEMSFVTWDFTNKKCVYTETSIYQYPTVSSSLLVMPYSYYSDMTKNDFLRIYWNGDLMDHSIYFEDVPLKRTSDASNKLKLAFEKMSE